MNRFEAERIIEGAILSDASVCTSATSVNAYFTLGQWNKPPDWLKCVQEALHEMNLPSGNIIKSEGVYSNTGKPYIFWRLQTRVHPVYTEWKRVWYPGNKKEVPGKLNLTPLSLAHWFMGDGSSIWLKSSHVLVRLHTRGYSLTSIKILEGALQQLGLSRVGRNNFKAPKYGAGIDLVVGRVADVSMFMDMVEPFVLPPYRYKIKRPSGSSYEFEVSRQIRHLRELMKTS